jgi:hypothetical protein
MNAIAFLMKEAVARVDIDLERAIELANARQRQLRKQIEQYRKIEELGHVARTHPAWHAATTGGIGAGASLVPGILLGGWKGALLGAGLGGLGGALYGLGRGGRAREQLKILRKGGLVAGEQPTETMRALAGGMARAR